MSEIVVASPLAPSQRDAVLARADQLGERAQLELRDGAGYTGVYTDDGYAHVARLPIGDWALDVVGSPAPVVPRALQVIAEQGGGTVQWWILNADDRAVELAASLGFRSGRELHRMERSLPLDEDVQLPPGVVLRAFEPGRDEQQWIEVNNRAFAGHPEQSGWSLEQVQRREREPWFDAAGVLLAVEGDDLVAFCWTKQHPDHVGEIYVIAVDPAHQDRGLGRAMTIAGLHSLADRGSTTGMLHVDAANHAAVHMYDALGFRTTRTDRAFTTKVQP